MKIKLYRSATVGIISKDYKLLQDPWLTDGEYYGSWYHYPSFEFNNYLDEINSYNGIYIYDNTIYNFRAIFLSMDYIRL